LKLHSNSFKSFDRKLLDGSFNRTPEIIGETIGYTDGTNPPIIRFYRGMIEMPFAMSIKVFHDFI